MVEYSVFVTLNDYTQTEVIFQNIVDALECATKFIKRYPTSLLSVEINAVQETDAKGDYNELYNILCYENN